MGDFFSTIGNLVGGIFGIPQEQAAQKAKNQSAEQYNRQKGYQDSGAGIYGQLGSQGAAQYADYHNNYLNLLSQFGNLSGLGDPLSHFGGPGQPAYGGTQGAIGGTSHPGQWNMAQPTNQAAIDAAGGPSVIAQYNQGPQPQPTSASSDPYALDTYQQQQLNQSQANIARQAKSAVGSFEQQMNAHGITDPRALQVGREQIHEHFAALSADTQTKFYEQAKKDKLAALQSIIGEIQQYGQQGIGQQEAAGSGYLGLAGGAGASYAQNQNVALQQQQSSQDAIGGLLNLAGFGAGGGFRQPSAATPTDNSVPPGAVSPGIIAGTVPYGPISPYQQFLLSSGGF